MQPDDRGELLLAAEPAAGLGLDHAGRLVVEAEPALERRVEVVRALERARDGHAAALGRAPRSSRCSRCRAAPGDRPGTRPRRRRRRAANAASRSPPASIVYWANVCSDTSGSKTAGAASSCAAVARWRASRRVALSGAARRASGSAWCWISPPIGTRIGWSLLIELTMLSPGMSAAVTTTTFDQSKAGSSSSAIERGVRVGRTDRGAVPRPGDDDVVRVQRRAGELGRALATQRAGRPRHARARSCSGCTMTAAPARSSGSWRGRSGFPPWRATIPPGTARPPDRAPSGPDATGPVARGAGPHRQWSGGAIRWSHSRRPDLSSGPPDRSSLALIHVHRHSSGVLAPWKSRRASCCQSCCRDRREHRDPRRWSVCARHGRAIVQRGHGAIRPSEQRHVELVRRQSARSTWTSAASIDGEARTADRATAMAPATCG